MRTTMLFFAFFLSFSSSFPALAQRTPLFRDFPTGAVYVGRHSEPDLSSRDAYAFRTRLREASREDVNFASHYRVVTWGCGTSCVSGAVVDVISGRVTVFPFSICCSAKIGEADFQPVLVRPNSRLIVFVGLRGEEQPDAAHYYEFTGSQFRFIASSKPFAPAPDTPSISGDVQPIPAQNLSAKPAPASTASLPPAPAKAVQPDASDHGNEAATDESARSRIVLVIAIGLVILIWFLKRRNLKIRKERVLKAVYDTVEHHKRALVRKRFQSLRHDDYGNVIVEQWGKELLYFAEKVLDPVLRQIGTKEYMLYENMRPTILSTIESTIREQANSSDSFTLGPNLTPTDYEQYCAQQLRAAGWTANTTKTTGDQGTDIVARKGDLRLVVQCKLYNHPVGNKAVQEVAAARVHEQADFAAVVTNARYTFSAQQLAATNGVLLLHHIDLTDIDNLIST